IKTFLIGLLLGLLVGGGFFVFKLNDYFKDFNKFKMLLKNTKDTVITIVPMQTKIPIIEKKEKNNISTSTKVNAKKVTDTIPEKNNISNNIAENAKTDSLSNSNLQSENTDDIVVKKDELLLTKTISIADLDAPLSKKQLKADSLLAVVSDTKDEAVPTSYFQVEYWSSPLNYKGYKMSKNKILLYGMDLTADIKLFQKDGFVYLKTPDAAYKLIYTDDFRQYEKVSDKDLLAQLNKAL
ncbi:MAG TPA: hypothetical protein VNG53_06500, partial [Bacteroidia bacterium]|nr:hypothetical protein [Bacteroidia bacterium]